MTSRGTQGIKGMVKVLFCGLALGIAAAEGGKWLYTSLVFLLWLLWRHRGVMHYLILVFAIAYVYWSLAHPVAPELQEGIFKGRVTVVSAPVVKEKGTSFIGVDEVNKMRLRVWCNFPVELKAGDVIEAWGTIRRIKPPSNPSEFDYREYYAHRRIFFILSVKEPYGLRVMEHRYSLLGDLWHSLWQNASSSLNASMGKREALMLAGMLFGRQEELEPDDLLLFQKTGLVHLLSVSGFHVGFIMLMGVLISQGLGLSKRGKILVVSLFLLVYGFMALWPISLVRASLMAWLGLIAYYYGRDNDLVNSLFLAGSIILLINPSALFEISFQLSFLATWGLVYLYPVWAKRSTKAWTKPILASLAPQMAVLPLATYYFNLISFISTAANFILVNVAGIAVILGFLGVVVSQFCPEISGVFLFPAGLLVKTVLWGTACFSHFPYAYSWTAQPPWAGVVCAYCGLMILSSSSPITGKRPQDMAMAWGLVIFYLVGVIRPVYLQDPGRLKVVFLDVGQGDAVYIKTPYGTTMLIDGGGAENFEVGTKVVLPYLRRQGVRRLDVVLATHPHVDHIKGLTEVLRELPADIIITGVGCSKHLQSYGRVVELKGSRVLKLDETTFLWLWGPYGDNEGKQDNEKSVLAKVVFGQTSFLFTGDAGKEELKHFLEEEFNANAQVLKIPHHGSRYSWFPEFLEEVKPQYAVISVGAHNPFGHPDPVVLEGLKAKNIEVLRTDEQGAVTFISDGNKIRCNTILKAPRWGLPFGDGTGSYDTRNTGLDQSPGYPGPVSYGVKPRDLGLKIAG